MKDTEKSRIIYKKRKQELKKELCTTWTKQQKIINKIHITADLINQLNSVIRNCRLQKNDYAFNHFYKSILQDYHRNRIYNKLTYDVLSEIMGTKQDFQMSNSIKISDLNEIAQVAVKIKELWEDETKQSIN